MVPAIDPDVLVGGRINERRRTLGRSISETSLASGISRPDFELIEKGERRPSPEQLTRIAATLEISITSLLAPES